MSEDPSLAKELEATRRELAQLKEQAERNSEILARSQARELSLLRAVDLQTLVHALLDGLRDSYALDHVTVIIPDPEHEVRHLLLDGMASEATPDGLLFVEGMSVVLPRYTDLEVSWLGEYRPDEHRMVFPGERGPGSVALIPLRQGGQLFGAVNFLSKNRDRFQKGQATDFLDHLGAIAAFALENAVNRARLRRSGFTDVLTGWYNRRYLQVRLVEELARAKRDSTSLACLILDIDHFKRVNDSHGHAAGDAVLRELAQKIAKRIRTTDVAARYGGEEFVILLPHTDTGAGITVAESIRRAVAEDRYGAASGLSLRITVSLGVSSVAPGRGTTDFQTMGDEMLARADRALYRAKAAGRNRVESDDEGDR